MRIISGKYRAKKIKPPQKLPVRPTTDFAKESLFNVLSNRVDFKEIEVLDLFAGTGNISFEFASRDCKSIRSVDINFKCIDFINKIANELMFENLSGTQANVFSFLKTIKTNYDLIFADPPFDLPEIECIPEMVFENKLLTDYGILIIEHSRTINFEDHPNFYEHRKYGNVHFSFFQNS
ncbi:MAG: methyltransferase domain-containing protein [Bacteroidetes bacterium]|nr:methyltransferase domain-containing protein [Bacteroidota bacterium]